MMSSVEATPFFTGAAYLQAADAGQEPHYVTFNSLGECLQFGKFNPELGFSKSDCQKGAPPEQPPTEV